MTVKELIEELEDMPMDLPVVSELKEIANVELKDSMYFLDKTSSEYYACPAVVLR